MQMPPGFPQDPEDDLITLIVELATGLDSEHLSVLKKERPRVDLMDEYHRWRLAYQAAAQYLVSFAAGFVNPTGTRYYL